MHPVQVDFHTLIEDLPGPAWQGQFERLWPAYRSWYLRSGMVDRPSYVESRRALREHMPELVPVWEQLVELAGGGDVESRFLSLWCPPPYIAGCSQAVWIDAHGGDGRSVAGVLLVAERNDADTVSLCPAGKVGDRDAGQAEGRLDAVEFEGIDDQLKAVGHLL